MEKCKLVLAAVFALGQAVDLAKANDGKFTIGDIPLMVGPGLLVPGALAAAKAAELEWKGSSDEAKAELIKWSKENFNIHDKHAEKQIEAGIAMLVHAGNFFEPAAE
jgi:hypothetical protein